MQEKAFFMELIDLIRKNRSIRRFDESMKIDQQLLINFVEHARLSASARNQQSLKFLLVNDTEKNQKIFPLLRWAGYLTDWDGPGEGERPAAYIVVLHDNKIAKSHFCDEGIAMQSITLAAAEAGFGCCIIASVDRDKLRSTFRLPGHLDILDVVAIGKPAEKAVLEEMTSADYKYWRDEHDVHHVPKRPQSEILWQSDLD